jgi:hypothetical protein
VNADEFSWISLAVMLAAWLVADVVLLARWIG